jgi:toxin ParE1/3/4
MESYQLSKTAQAELDSLYLYGILNYGLRQADVYYNGLIECLDLLAQYRNWGSDYSFISPNLQRYEYSAHSIYYQPSENGILIVLGNRQDPARHF